MSNGKSSKYSFDLMTINDENFRGELHRAFSSMRTDAEAGFYSREDAPAVENAVLEGFRKKYDMPEAELSRVLDAWNKAGKQSFSYIESNPWDIQVKASEDYGYDWLMNLTDDQLLDYAVSNPTLSKKYNLTNSEDEYERLIREQHAAAETGGMLVRSKIRVRHNSIVDANRIAGMNAGFDTKIARWTEANMAFIDEEDETIESMIEDLQRNGFLDESADKHLRKLSLDLAKDVNRNRASEALDDIRYINEKEELSDYYLLREEAAKGAK